MNADPTQAALPATSDAIVFSVVLATRNRGGLLARALGSVVAQRGVRLEAIVVDDGSSPDHAQHVADAVARAEGVARLLSLRPHPSGHGPSLARNVGAAAAVGEFLAFLDDDDEWTDPDHLARCAESMDAMDAPADLYFGDQRARMPDGSEPTGPLWLRGLEKRLGKQPDAQGAFEANIESLLRLGGLCHLNATVLRRRLFETLGGFDERLRYEEDRDLCLRAIDSASRILYHPAQIGLHYVPDPLRCESASATTSPTDKRLAQLLLLDKAMLGCRQAACRRHARRAKRYVLDQVASQLEASGRYRDAQTYRLQALATDFGFKLLARSALGAILTVVSRP